jgi:limonene-1,2-epoxide hydrolase
MNKKMGNAIEPLTVERFRELWSKTYNTAGKPDWSHIFPYYHEDVVFQDSIQRIEGIKDFTAMCQRLTERCEQLNMDILSVATKPGEIFFEWKMTMIFTKTPSTPVFGCSKLTIGEDGRIMQQRDYFDLWGDIFNGIPNFKKTYRKFMRKYFG